MSLLANANDEKKDTKRHSWVQHWNSTDALDQLTRLAR